MNDLIELQHKYFKPILLEGKPKKDIYHQYFKSLFKQRKFPDTKYDGMNDTKWAYDPEIDSKKFREIQINTIINHFKVTKDEIIFIEHHPAHAAYAYYASPFREKEALVFTLDGVGENINATISCASQDSLREIYRSGEANLGRLWKYITLLLAMMPDQHEFKVMGLAPYANKKYANEVLEIFQNNFQYIDNLDFKYKNKTKDIYFTFNQLLEGKRFDSIAGGLQLYTEKLVTQWIKNAISKFGISRVVFSGGVSMNIKLNKAIAEMPEVEEFYVSPSGGDESLALGVYYKHLGNNETPELTNIYLGPEYNQDQILKVLSPYEDKFIITKNVDVVQIASFLSEGYVIARFDGRMEFGARALGNRSILANPSKIETVKKINTQIKSRDFWMPFTATILDTRENDYIVNPKGIQCPYMTIAFESTELGRNHLKAAMHPYDFTVRPQILTEIQNPKYYQLIKEFEKTTGIGGLLNTSLNLHGYPVVCSPKDAIETFANSKLDMLLMGDILIRREN